MALMMIVCVVILTFQTIFCRMYSTSRGGEGAAQYSVMYSLLVGLCCLVFNGFSYAPSHETLLFGLANALMLYLYNVAMVRASSLGSYAFLMVSSLVGGLAMPTVYDVASVGTRLGWLQWIAVGLILISFVLMNLDGLGGKKNLRYLLWVVALFFANGVYNLLMGMQQTIMEHTQRSEMLVTTYIGGAAVVLLSQLATPGKFIRGFRMPAKSWIFMACAALCCAIGGNMSLYAMQRMSITAVTVINHGGVLAGSALAAYLLFKEKATLPKIAGLLFAGTGIVLLLL